MEKRANGEGSIYQCKRGQWVVAISLGAGKKKYFYCRSQGEAVFVLQQAQQGRLLGTLASTRNETVETFLLNWLKYEIQPKVRERTYQTYQQTVTQDLLPSLGKITLQKLTSWHIQELYQQKRQQQVAPSTIYKIHRTLHHALNDAVKLGHVLRNVGQFVELPPVAKRERVIQALTFKQARKLLTAAQDNPLEALYVKLLSATLDGLVVSRPEPLSNRNICAWTPPMIRLLSIANCSRVITSPMFAAGVRSGERNHPRISGKTLGRGTHASWLNRSRRILIRWEKKAENYPAFLRLACGQLLFAKIAVFG